MPRTSRPTPPTCCDCSRPSRARSRRIRCASRTSRKRSRRPRRRRHADREIPARRRAIRRTRIRKILGGVFGEGFIERIVRGYTFVSRNYAPGDRIYLAGFSRGAYTVRALGGMIAAMGLLPPDAMRADDGSYDADQAYSLGIYVWADYRRAAGKQSTLLGYLEEFKSQSHRPRRGWCRASASRPSASGTRSARWACRCTTWPMRRRSTSSSSPTGRCRPRCAADSMRSPSTSSAATSNRRCGTPGTASSSAGSAARMPTSAAAIRRRTCPASRSTG